MKRPHLPKINWRYALGELTIVVVGILIAPALNPLSIVSSRNVHYHTTSVTSAL